MEDQLGTGVRLIGQIRKNADTTIVVTLRRQRKIYAVDVREFVESEDFTGWTKRGIRLNTELVPELIDLLQDAWQAEGEEGSTNDGSGTVPPEFVLRMRAVGESIEAIASSCGALPAQVRAVLQSRGGTCPKCSTKLPTEGEKAYICPTCSIHRT